MTSTGSLLTRNAFGKDSSGILKFFVAYKAGTTTSKRITRSKTGDGCLFRKFSSGSYFCSMLKNLFAKKRKVKRYYRTDFLQSIPTSGDVLEIGPFYKPFVRGENIKYFDIMDRDALIKRAAELEQDFKPEDVPFIDYVSPIGDLSIINEKFDAVFSSHVIEHQFDLIDHLQKVSRLLKPGGRYYVIAPDKRYCFDHFQPESTVADVIDAHYEKRKKHSLKNVILHRAFITHNSSGHHWQGENGTLENIPEKIKDAIEEYSTKPYIDVHALFMTPDTLTQIIKLLNQLNYIDLDIERIHPTEPGGIEFFFVLTKK